MADASPLAITPSRLSHVGVNSSSVRSIGYDAPNKILEVRFHGSGKTFAYHDVPYDVHLRLSTAASKGKYISQVIAKNHRVTQVR